MDRLGREITYLGDYRETAYAIAHVRLNFAIGPEGTKVSSALRLAPRSGTETGEPLVLSGDGLTLVSVTLDGKELDAPDYVADASSLTIIAPPPGPFTLTTEVDIDPAANTQLMGLYRSNGVWCTQCEPEGFRRITYFLDRPDVLATYEVRIEAPKEMAPVLLSNGNRIETGDLPDGRHFSVWQDPFPKPSYLFALVAGDLGHLNDTFTTMSGRKVTLGIYCETGKEPLCAYAMDALKRSMAWDERRFGREYDLDMFNIVAVSDFNFGAMENKGLNIFNDRFVLADPGSATDADYGNIERIIAHEYFHNWTGDRITCRDWFQLCLKEGLTVFRDQEFTSDERSRPVKRITDVLKLKAAQFPEDAGPLAHPARPDRYREIENFYTATVYDKGAEIVRMLATLLGPGEFRKGMDLYFERHDGEATTIEAWIKVFEESSGRDLEHFKQWYLQAGTPEVTVSDHWDAETKTYRLKLRQSVGPTPHQPDKQPMMLPIRFGLVGANGHDMDWSTVRGGRVEGDLIVADAEACELVFEGLAGKPIPSLFRGFSAPVKIVSPLSDDDRMFLARHDADPVNRWQALQDAALDMMVDAVAGGPLDARKAGKLADALGDTLAAEDLDDAFKALALALPGETAIAQALGSNIDPTRIRKVRRSLETLLGETLYGDLDRTRAGLRETVAPQAIDAQSAGARSLANQCLGLMAASGAANAGPLIEAQYAKAQNMTDRIAALGIAVGRGLSFAEALMADFRKQFGADPLIFDKWLSLVATDPSENALDRVKAVLEEPDFPRNNPNRLRSLVGGFAMGNTPQFARPDGEGFRFVAEVCRSVDRVNPQVAAGLLTRFRTWRMYEPGRRAEAWAALEALRGGGPLSANVTDILERILAA